MSRTQIVLYHIIAKVIWRNLEEIWSKTKANSFVNRKSTIRKTELLNMTSFLQNGRGMIRWKNVLKFASTWLIWYHAETVIPMCYQTKPRVMNVTNFSKLNHSANQCHRCLQNASICLNVIQIEFTADKTSVSLIFPCNVTDTINQ